jgi:hypothetical protein
MLAFIAIGRQVFNFDMSELSSRRNDFILAFSEKTQPFSTRSAPRLAASPTRRPNCGRTESASVGDESIDGSWNRLHGNCDVDRVAIGAAGHTRQRGTNLADEYHVEGIAGVLPRSPASLSFATSSHAPRCSRIGPIVARER